jgi:hypothetical protein
VYQQAPSIFLGRRGRGQLDVVWDTNLLIDYMEFGRRLWDEIGFADLPEERRELLDALQLIVTLSVMRDIRFHLLAGVLQDAKRALGPQRLEERTRAIDEFAAALMLSHHDYDYGSPDTSEGLLLLPPSEKDFAVSQVPIGMDRRLVQESMESGFHVFLTADKGILKAAQRIRPFGMLICTPPDLMEELFSSGAALCLFERRFATWPLPDVQRISHLIQALPPAA